MKNAPRIPTGNGPLTLAPALLLALSVGLSQVPAAAQVALGPTQLDQLVARVALYPDPLLAQALTASTFSNSFRMPRSGRTSTAI